MTRLKFYVFILALTVVFTGCQQPANAPLTNQTVNMNANAGSANNQWDKYVEGFLNDYFVAHPEFAVYQGKHEFDGKLPDWSEDGLKKEIGRLHAERDKAAAFKDDQLDERQGFERDYLISQIDKDLFWREIADQPHTNPYFYSDSIDPDVYVSREYAPLETRIKSYTAYAKNVPNALGQIKANLKLPIAKTLVKIGRTTIGGLADFYSKDVPTVFASVKEEQLQKDFKQANDGAIAAIKDFDAWLGSQEANANDNFALGTDKFRLMLRQTEGVDIDLARLEEIGRQDLERNTNALKQECGKFLSFRNCPMRCQKSCVVLIENRRKLLLSRAVRVYWLSSEPLIKCDKTVIIFIIFGSARTECKILFTASPCRTERRAK